MDDIPSFSSASPVSGPISRSSCHFFTNRNTASEKQEGDSQSSSFASNNNSSASHSSIRPSCNPSPALKTRTLSSSLSFSRVSENKPVIHNKGSSVVRAASFQSRLNPNICSSLSGPGSDNNSLHSSTSSLEYSGGAGYTMPAKNLASYPSHLPQRECHGRQLQCQQQHLEANIKKFSSHGSVFKSEIKQVQEMMIGIEEPQRMNHGSMSILDLQITDEEVGIMDMKRGGSGGRICPGIPDVDGNGKSNGRHHNISSLGKSGSKQVYQQESPQVFKTTQPKAKETPRLNKFPLDLDSLVSSISTTSPTKTEAVSITPNAPKHVSQSSGGPQYQIHSLISTAVTPSDSLSRLSSSSNTPCHLFSHPGSPFPPYPSNTPQRSISVTEMSCSPVHPHPGKSIQQDILTGSQVVKVAPSLHYSSSSPSSRAVCSLEDRRYDERDSMDLILASFTWPDINDTTLSNVTPPPKSIQRNGALSSTFGCLTETAPMTTWQEEKKKHGGKMFFEM